MADEVDEIGVERVDEAVRADRAEDRAGDDADGGRGEHLHDEA